MDAAVSLLMGYLVGMINPSYIIARIKGFDIRKSGSGNAGGSNALITMGTAIGVLCMVFDIVKAFGVIKLAQVIFPESTVALACAAVGTVAGHIFPPYMKFKGGKGLACLAGSIIAFDPIIFLIFLGCEAVIAFSTNYICFVPMTASVAFPVVYALVTKNVVGTVILCAITLMILLRHVENIKKIRNGTEMRLSYLWKKDAERDRVVSNGEEKQD